MKPMKVVLSAKSVYPFHPVGGVQKYVYYFAKHLQRKGVDLEIVAPLDKGKPRSENYEGLKYTFLKPAIYHYLEYPIGWLGVHLFSQSLSRYLQDNTFDLLHSFDMTGYHYIKLKKRKPVIAHIFTDNYLCNPISLGNPVDWSNLNVGQHNRIKEAKVRISPFSDRKTKIKYGAQYLFKIKPMYTCLKNADCIFYEADKFKREVNELYHFQDGRGTIIPVGTDIAMAAQSADSFHVSRKSLGFHEEDKILITVNRLAADKGVDKIVLALEQIIRKNPAVKLIIIGAGYQEKEILDLISQKRLSQHVMHFKNVPESQLVQYYRLSDLYISAFSYPGSSVSTLEAMACSLPVITTAQPWLVRNNENGMVLEHNDPELIARAVLDLIAKCDLKAMGQKSGEIVKDYDWQLIVDEACDQYNRILHSEGIYVKNN